MTPENTVRRGEIVVIKREGRYNNLLMGAYAGYTSYRIAEVTNVNTAGVALKVRYDHNEGGRPLKIDGTLFVLPEAMREPARRLLGQSFDSKNALKDAIDAQQQPA